MLATLETLKSKSLRAQVEIIAALAESNLDLYEHLYSLFCRDSGDSIFRLTVSGDREKVVRIAFLALVGADIATVPDAHSRGTYIARLTRVCQHFDVDYKDVVAVVAHARAIEEILESEGL